MSRIMSLFTYLIRSNCDAKLKSNWSFPTFSLNFFSKPAIWKAVNKSCYQSRTRK